MEITNSKASMNWFPGHMKKTFDMLKEQIKIVDVVIEILDARIPFSSMNPKISEVIKSKKRIILLNKVDLVDKSKIFIWEKYLLEMDLADYVIPISVENGFNIKPLRSIIEKMYEEKLEKLKKKGFIKTEIKAMVVGIPNVGKSKFINKISSKAKAAFGNTPGFTRGKQWIAVSNIFYLLDTPGVLWPKFENQEVALNLAITGSIKDNNIEIENCAISLIDKMEKFGILENIYKAYNIDKKIYKDRYELLKEIENRLLIHNIKKYDYEKVSIRILKDYRQGKLGRFFLELPKEGKFND